MGKSLVDIIRKPFRAIVITGVLALSAMGIYEAVNYEMERPGYRVIDGVQAAGMLTAVGLICASAAYFEERDHNLQDN